MQMEVGYFGAIYHIYEDGEPCDHIGCIDHVSHPCEECLRTGAIGQAKVIKIKNKEKNNENKRH
jgi:hypothetical protein